MVAKGHKITNVPLFKKLRTLLGPLKMSLEMAHKVTVSQKKIMSCTFLNSGKLIVIKSLYGRYRYQD
jgi:hypothetical protein